MKGTKLVLAAVIVCYLHARGLRATRWRISALLNRLIGVAGWALHVPRILRAVLPSLLRGDGDAACVLRWLASVQQVQPAGGHKQQPTPLAVVSASRGFASVRLY